MLYVGSIVSTGSILHDFVRGNQHDSELYSTFSQHYNQQVKHLKLKDLKVKTIDACSCAIRRLGAYLEHRIDPLTEGRLTEYLSHLMKTHSRSAVKLDLYGLRVSHDDNQAIKVDGVCRN